MADCRCGSGPCARSSPPRRTSSGAPCKQRHPEFSPPAVAPRRSQLGSWCARRTAPARPGWRARRTAPARPRWRAHVGQLQLGPVAHARTAAIVAGRRAQLGPVVRASDSSSSARRRVPGAAIVEGSQRAPVEARASDSASSGLWSAPGDAQRPPSARSDAPADLREALVGPQERS
jgi:hypothetical protein